MGIKLSDGQQIPCYVKSMSVPAAAPTLALETSRLRRELEECYLTCAGAGDEDPTVACKRQCTPLVDSLSYVSELKGRIGSGSAMVQLRVGPTNYAKATVRNQGYVPFFASWAYQTNMIEPVTQLVLSALDLAPGSMILAAPWQMAGLWIVTKQLGSDYSHLNDEEFARRVSTDLSLLCDLYIEGTVLGFGDQHSGNVAVNDPRKRRSEHKYYDFWPQAEDISLQAELPDRDTWQELLSLGGIGKLKYSKKEIALEKARAFGRFAFRVTRALRNDVGDVIIAPVAGASLTEDALKLFGTSSLSVTGSARRAKASDVEMLVHRQWTSLKKGLSLTLPDGTPIYRSLGFLSSEAFAKVHAKSIFGHHIKKAVGADGQLRNWSRVDEYVRGFAQKCGRRFERLGQEVDLDADL
jgi:hypothetical protein